MAHAETPVGHPLNQRVKTGNSSVLIRALISQINPLNNGTPTNRIFRQVIKSSFMDRIGNQFIHLQHLAAVNGGDKTGIQVRLSVPVFQVIELRRWLTTHHLLPVGQHRISALRL